MQAAYLSGWNVVFRLVNTDERWLIAISTPDTIRARAPVTASQTWESRANGGFWRPLKMAPNKLGYLRTRK
jgi:hypothetical protein